MDWIAERRRMFGSSKKIVSTFDEFILDSSVIQSFYSYSSNITVPVDTKNCTRYVVSMGISNAAMSIDKIDNGAVTNLFSYASGFRPNNIVLTAYDTSAILFNVGCLGFVIDPLDLNISSCDDILRSATVIDSDYKGESSGDTAMISDPYKKGATYVIAALADEYRKGARLVKVDSDISFTTLAYHGYVYDLLTGVDSGSIGHWWVYCYTDDYEGVSNDTYAEAIYALSFDE